LTEVAARGRKLKRRSKALTIIYAVVGFFAVGYFPTLALRHRFGPQFSMVAAAVGMIFVGSATRSVPRAVIRGLGLGLLAGMAISIALIHAQAIPPDQILRTTGIYTFATAFLCTAVAALFAHAAVRRAERIESHWK